MKYIIFFAVFGLVFADHHKSKATCTQEFSASLITALEDCRRDMTTPTLPTSTTSALAEIDSDSSSSEEDDPIREAIKNYFAECVSKKIEAETSAAPVIGKCFDKFAKGKISEAKKYKCNMKEIRKTCDLRRLGTTGPGSVTSSSPITV